MTTHDMPLGGQAEIESLDDLEDRLSAPTPRAVAAMGRLKGDLLLLGAGGKMGPTLARMARYASDAAGVSRRVIAVSRFGDAAVAKRLESFGVETIACDLLDPDALAGLPDAANVLYLAGMKFGTSDRPDLTWVMNACLPAAVCRKFRGARIVAFSTGNVYPPSPVALGGSVETDPPSPLGEYAMSCLGRERVFEHFARTFDMPVALVRLNYACELRYGVLLDLAQRVASGHPINVTMGHFNAIWQGDANAMTLAAFDHAAVPPFVVNVAGPETLSVRRVCQTFARRLGKSVQFVGSESAEALLSNGQLGHRLFGYPQIPVEQVIEWVAAWVARGGPTHGKPTHFDARNGRY